ncbi:acyl-CoA N-acyltransferase [Apodospora peruviana]|uniref:Acyl-CoA N-acyltransferase n=1 Tax=Apodospora peruviana TaxID=516989 RepID=A0AAE0ICY5_9PEZI|nr:acyl-CoA N-acyltransferase [Apodospora peruviana]
MANQTQNISIIPAQRNDIPILAAISEAALEKDSQTEMKSHGGKEAFSMKEYSLSSLPGLLRKPKARVIKAVDTNTGVIMGHCIWGFRGMHPPDFPADDDDDDTPNPTSSSADVNDPQFTENSNAGEPDEAKDDGGPIARLERFTDADFKEWMDSVMPEGAACLYIIGLYVLPAFQRRGVGSALLKWGTDLVDAAAADKNAFAWVHSSAGAWKAYEKAGFEVVRTLDVDLDEYAPVPAPEDRYEGGKWGRYVFRYMIYRSKLKV